MYSVSTTCATRNGIINKAAMHIRRDECNPVIAGGSEAAMVQVGLGGFILSRAPSSLKENRTRESHSSDTKRQRYRHGILISSGNASAGRNLYCTVCGSCRFTGATVERIVEYPQKPLECQHER